MSHRWCENATFPVSSGPCLPHLSGQVQLRCSNNEGLLTAHTVRPLGVLLWSLGLAVSQSYSEGSLAAPILSKWPGRGKGDGGWGVRVRL